MRCRLFCFIHEWSQNTNKTLLFWAVYKLIPFILPDLTYQVREKMLSDFKNIFNFSLSRIVLTPGWSQTMQFYCDMVWIEKRGWTYASVWHTSFFVKTTTIIAPINKLACCLYAEHDVSVSGFNLRCFAVRSVASQSIQCYITFQSYPMHLTFSVRLPFRRCILSLLLRSPYDSL